MTKTKIKLKGGPMEKQNEAKKIKWNIANAMTCVLVPIKKSKGKVKKTKQYETALERLKSLYSLTVTQLWILCYTIERQLEHSDSTGLKNIASYMDVPAMQIISWNKDVKVLVNKGFLEWQRQNVFFEATSELLESLFDNCSFIPPEKRELDETDFLNQFADRYESRREESMSARAIQRELGMLEKRHSKLGMIKRVMAEIEDSNSRFFLYDVTHDLMRQGDSHLNATICDLYDGEDRYKIASQMMDETHELFKKGLLEFSKKGNLAEARVTLSSKGKKLVLAEKAFLFEDTINDKNLIKNEDIKSKRLFYSPENQYEIEKLKNALQEDNLNKIQQRLNDDGLPTGVAILLHGAPGTGKTETVYQIAKETGRSIVHVDISEAKSAWFGESEKRIKKIFTSYKNACEINQKKGEKIPILLFNEADALISKRKDDTSGSVAQTENAIQNIILEELENLKGIFIATSNLAINFDRAFERRFLFKIGFENPSKEAKVSIWMNKLSWLDQSTAEKLADQFDFSGGQIDNIVRKAAMNEVISGNKPNVEELHSMCKLEKLDPNSSTLRIGFGV